MDESRKYFGEKSGEQCIKLSWGIDSIDARPVMMGLARDREVSVSTGELWALCGIVRSLLSSRTQ